MFKILCASIIFFNFYCSFKIFSCVDTCKQKIMLKYKFHSEKCPKAISTNLVEEPLILLNQSNIKFHINFFRTL